MKVLTIILGIILTICGVACLIRPGEAFLETGYIIAIMLLVYGIIGIIAVIARAARPAFLWACIPAVIIGVISLFFPSDRMNIHAILLYLLAFWFIVQGISSMYLAVRSRFFNRGWVLGLIIGILSILVGIYTALHPALGVFTIGILVGIYLIEAGIDLIVVGTTIGRVQHVVDGVASFVDDARAAVNEEYERMASYQEAPAPEETNTAEEANTPDDNNTES